MSNLTTVTTRMVTVRKATPKRTSAPMTAAESIFQSRGTKRKKEERRPE